jgi:hypothetical protein
LALSAQHCDAPCFAAFFSTRYLRITQTVLPPTPSITNEPRLPQTIPPVPSPPLPPPLFFRPTRVVGARGVWVTCAKQWCFWAIMVLRIFPPLVVSCAWEKALFITFSATCGWLFPTGASRPPITSQARPSASAKRPTPASAAIIPWLGCACLADARRFLTCLCGEKRTELWRLFLFGGELGIWFADARGIAVEW